MNFLQVVRISLERVAENIITCLWWGVARKISWTSRRMSEGKNLSYGFGACGRFGAMLGKYTRLKVLVSGGEFFQ